MLRQDPWETLVTFIISQRKSIPAIAKAVELLAARFGQATVTDYEELRLFPTPEAMKDAGLADLASCGLGYRTPYVLNAIEKVCSGALDLERIGEEDDEGLIEALRTVRGVGVKVGRCTALFAYGRMACVPIDVWIARAIEECGGESPFELFGEEAGIIQQYVFYSMIHGKDRKKAD